MDCFPYEILEYITKYLDVIDVINFMKTSKNVYRLNVPSFWKIRLYLDYPKGLKYKKSSSPKLSYIIAFNTLCIGCNKKTKVVEGFSGKLVCICCQKIIPKFKTICQSSAKDSYLLTDKDLKCLPYTTKPNRFNNSRPTKLYRKEDIMKLVNDKHGIDNLPNLIRFRNSKQFRRSLNYILRFNLLSQCLYNIHDININNVIRDIDKYSGNNAYRRYLKYGGLRVNPSDLIFKCIELNFIQVNTDIHYSLWGNFDATLLHHLLITPCHTTRYFHPYIQRKIIILKKDNREKFFRRISVLKELKFVDMEDPFIYSYVYEEINNLSTLRRIMALKKFVYEYTNISDIILHNLLNDIKHNLISIYVISLNKWYLANQSTRHLLPSILTNFVITY
jgi:hypothetical protein